MRSKYYAAVSLLLAISGTASAGITSDLEDRVRSAFQCSMKGSLFAKDGDWTVRMSDITKVGSGQQMSFRGDAMIIYLAGRKETYKFYGTTKQVGDELRILEINIEMPNDPKNDRTLPGACIH